MTGVAWNGAEALRGLACAVPGALVAATSDVAVGCAIVLGTLPVVLMPMPAERPRRLSLLVAGLAFAGAYAAGAVLVTWPAVAILAVAVGAYLGVLRAGSSAFARMVPALVVPALALAMNHPAPAGLVLAGLFVAGSAWATLVTVAWPAGLGEPPPPGHAAPAPAASPVPLRLYAAMVATAGAMGLGLGFALGFVHVAWAGGAALLIMRPVPGQTATRAGQRVAATFIGITVAAVLSAMGPGSLAIALVAALTLAGIVGTRSSRWYLTPGGTGLVVLLMTGVSGSGALVSTYRERLLETAVGAVLAIVFGVLLPMAAARRPGRATPEVG